MDNKLTCSKCGGTLFFITTLAEYLVENGEINKTPIEPREVFICLQDGEVITGVTNAEQNIQYYLVPEQSGKIERLIPGITPREIQTLTRNGIINIGEHTYITPSYMKKYNITPGTVESVH